MNLKLIDTLKGSKTLIKAMTTPYVHHYIVRFQDTDAAGIVYFSNVLRFCHEAYEASLQASCINLRTFFTNASMAVPIVEAQVAFAQPLYCGDFLRIEVSPLQLSSDTFEISYQLWRESAPTVENAEDPKADLPVAQAKTKHVCIDPGLRRRCSFSPELIHWLGLDK
jgi:1,4-dihydroxy-2-naphthoyl-CoA hydrolase